jgi:DNA-binding SARP family transcriptional activator
MASDPARSSLTIRVLGELQVWKGGALVPLPPSKKTRALLSYMVLTERKHRRERLCALFWDVTDDPRGALRWSVSKLRRLCDEPQVSRIVADRDSVSFERHGAFVDVLEARARISSAALEGLAFEELEQLAREFRGELLTGLELGDFDEFQSWCVAEREQARLLHQSVLRALVERSVVAEQALPHARALVHVDPLSQSARAGLVELLGRLGLEQEAEQQYQSGRRLLSELGARSTAELERAWQQAREALAERASGLVLASRVPADPAPVSSAVPFVGRARQCEEFAGILADVERGRARVLLISGEAGVGKSRVMQEFLARAGRAGGSVLTAAAYEVESGRSFTT